MESNYSPSFINSLCDIIPNKKRTINDFNVLLHVLEEAPKECTPFKARIIQHLQIHALGNSEANLGLLALCYAKATILFRKGQNKSEGPVGEWKEGFRTQISDLEKNLDQLYNLAGIEKNSILLLEQDDHLESQERLSSTKSDYKCIVNNYLVRVDWSAHCLRALISVKTDFAMPIPIRVLLRIALKIGSLRCKDYKKKPDSPLKSHIFSLTPHLIDISLMLIHSIITVLGTNIIPFSQFINQTLLIILEWTRSSNLIKHDERAYYSIRSKLFNNISFIIEQLSLNINFEPELFRNLIEKEILGDSNMSQDDTNCISGSSDSNNEMVLLKNTYMVDGLSCLENILIVYVNFLEPKLEGKIKNYVLQTFIKIYRDFESNVINVDCRKQLLKLLQVIANQPYATSTTEISYHIFELVEKLESDPEMKATARRCLKIGLAHRPTIVSKYDVYNSYNLPMENLINGTSIEQADDDFQEASQELEADHHEILASPQQQQVQDELPQLEPQLQPQQQPQSELQPQQQPQKQQEKQDNSHRETKVVDEDECQVLSYMSHFVGKLA